MLRNTQKFEFFFIVYGRKNSISNSDTITALDQTTKDD